MVEAVSEEGQGPAGKTKYPMKPVTFPSDDKRERVTKYCKERKVGFSELVRKLLDREMREVPTGGAEAPTIRVIKEPGK